MGIALLQLLLVLCVSVNSAGVVHHFYNTKFSTSCDDAYERDYTYYEYNVCYDGELMYRPSVTTGLAEVWQGNTPACENMAKTTDETLDSCPTSGNDKFTAAASLPSPRREAKILTLYSSNMCGAASILSQKVTYTSCSDAEEYRCREETGAGAEWWASVTCSRPTQSAAETRETTIVATNVYVVVAVSVVVVLGIIVTVLMVIGLCVLGKKKD